MIDFERLKNELTLDTETGFLYWKTSSQGRAAGERAGSLCANGYRHIQFDGQTCQEHTIIWYILYGVLEPNIDHKDRVRDNNRPSNLRKATRSLQKGNVNRKPNASGYQGVYWHNTNAKYYAQIKFDGLRVHLGYFDKAIDAHEAYKIAQLKYFGEFAHVSY